MNSVTLIGRVTDRAASTFVLSVAGVEVPVAHQPAPQPGDRVAVEGFLSSHHGTLFVQARALDILPGHMV